VRKKESEDHVGHRHNLFTGPTTLLLTYVI
jgi:hypothetical protein